jgi:hypothetical protein
LSLREAKRPSSQEKRSPRDGDQAPGIEEAASALTAEDMRIIMVV